MGISDEIRGLVDNNDVVLFMKGTRSAPQCGFSARVCDILDEYLDEYRTVNVLADPQLRQVIKEFSNWPTIPQLYVKGKFVGGSDIVHDMTRSGELADVLGTGPIELNLPDVTLAPAARAAFLRFSKAEADSEECVVRITVGSDWEALLDLDEERDGDVLIDQGDIAIVMTRSTARRVDGITVDFVERGGQMGFKVDNPNKPPMVNQLTVDDLHKWMDDGKPHLLVDVRTREEWATAKIPTAVLLDDDLRKKLDKMDRDKTIVLHCHHGMRSQQAATHLLASGFRDVHNLRGGIDAWSMQIDSDIPRY